MTVDLEAIKGARLLVVEDNLLNQQVAEELLTAAGFVVDVAENGKVALERVKETAYDAVLMDVQMPEMDGLEASRRITRDMPPDERPKIVAMTANAMEGDREMCLEAGMNDYITKPIKREAVFSIIEKNIFNKEAA